MFIGAATSNHTIRWVNALSDRGHEVLLVCRGDQQDINKQISNNVKIEYLYFGGKSLSYYLNVPQIRRIYKNFSPDIVNAHYVSGYGTLSRVARLRPLVLSAWGSDVYDFPYHSKFSKNLVNKNLEYTNAIACTSNAMAEQTRKIMGKPNQNITVTPFGVDVNLFSPAKNKSINERPVIGIVKYLEPIYDVGLLIRAFALLQDLVTSNPILEVYGGGSMKNELAELTKMLGIESSVKFNDTIPNSKIPSVLNTFDVFVNCSKQESFGVAIVEAMACELPVVATDTEGFREVVDDGVTGIVLKDRRPESMANALAKLLNNSELRMSMGSAGRKKVLSMYDWDKNVSIMENLYLETSHTHKKKQP